MISLRETQLGCAIVELLQHVQACRVQCRRSPAGRRLRSADVQQTIRPVDVLPTKPFDLTGAEAAVEPERRGDVRVQPCGPGSSDLKQPLLIFWRQRAADRRFPIPERGVLVIEAVPQLGSLENLSQDGKFAVDGLRCASCGSPQLRP